MKLINLSNHPVAKWEGGQMKAAVFQFAEVVDMEFPQISPCKTSEEVEQEAYHKLDECMKEGTPDNVVFHVAGEYGYCFSLIQLLLKNGYTCVHSTSIRKVWEYEGKAIREFEFIQFREYKLI